MYELNISCEQYFSLFESKCNIMVSDSGSPSVVIKSAQTEKPPSEQIAPGYTSPSATQTSLINHVIKDDSDDEIMYMGTVKKNPSTLVFSDMPMIALTNNYVALLNKKLAEEKQSIAEMEAILIKCEEAEKRKAELEAKLNNFMLGKSQMEPFSSLTGSSQSQKIQEAQQPLSENIIRGLLPETPELHQSKEMPQRQPLVEMHAVSELQLRKYTDIKENEYSDQAKKLLQRFSSTEGAAHVLQNVASAELKYGRMFVAPGLEGLVAIKDIPKSGLVSEYLGLVSTPLECLGREKEGYVQPHCVLYSGVSPDCPLIIDARRKGGDSRTVRRSCRPNTVLKHVVLDGNIYVFLNATEPIEKSTEITIPFDSDYQKCPWTLACACGDEACCPIANFNAGIVRKKEKPALADSASTLPPSFMQRKRKNAPMGVAQKLIGNRVFHSYMSSTKASSSKPDKEPSLRELLKQFAVGLASQPIIDYELEAGLNWPGVTES